jgi:Rod binding domain-containing protein
MRKTVPAEEGLFPKTRAEEFFDEMFDEYLSSEIARAGGLGLTSIYKKYIKE